MNIYFFDIIRI